MSTNESDIVKLRHLFKNESNVEKLQQAVYNYLTTGLLPDMDIDDLIDHDGCEDL
jgi:hypothetical protein